jgi:hypothetical protein
VAGRPLGGWSDGFTIGCGASQLQYQGWEQVEGAPVFAHIEGMVNG